MMPAPVGLQGQGASTAWNSAAQSQVIFAVRGSAPSAIAVEVERHVQGVYLPESRLELGMGSWGEVGQGAERAAFRSKLLLSGLTGEATWRWDTEPYDLGELVIWFGPDGSTGGNVASAAARAVGSFVRGARLNVNELWAGVFGSSARETSGTAGVLDMSASLRAIDELACAPDEWARFGLTRIEKPARDTARRVLEVAASEGLPEPAIVPISGGGVQLEWYSPARGLELIALPDGELEYVLVERPDAIVAEGELPRVDEASVRRSMRWYSGRS